ncbi:MAG: DEAD/DEAH box helicase family protein, partial [Planctomycetota bacterium]|nr:DEAD/DEAH box helicase family protein [Planctomycetota bacterium]
MTSAAAPALWDHQTQAVEFALERRATLFHMGLGTGKSRCAIEVAKQTEARRVLILCPLSVCDAWRDQFTRFGPEFVVSILSRGSVARKAKRAKDAAIRAAALGQPFVCVVNYESARNNPLAAWLAQQRF